MVLAIIEGLVLSFILLLVCVINIQNGPVGGVQYYEEPVKERVVEMGLITKEQIKKNKLCSGAVFMSALLIAAPLTVFFVNKATGFTERFDRTRGKRSNPIIKITSAATTPVTMIEGTEFPRKPPKRISTTYPAIKISEAIKNHLSARALS